MCDCLGVSAWDCLSVCGVCGTSDYGVYGWVVDVYGMVSVCVMCVVEVNVVSVGVWCVCMELQCGNVCCAGDAMLLVWGVPWLLHKYMPLITFLPVVL